MKRIVLVAVLCNNGDGRLLDRSRRLSREKSGWVGVCAGDELLVFAVVGALSALSTESGIQWRGVRWDPEIRDQRPETGY